MNLSGRSYIFAAATLFLLAAALRFYDDYAQTETGRAKIYAVKAAICDWASIDAQSMRFGCHSNLLKGGGNRISGGTITMGR